MTIVKWTERDKTNHRDVITEYEGGVVDQVDDDLIVRLTKVFCFVEGYRDQGRSLPPSRELKAVSRTAVST